MPYVHCCGRWHAGLPQGEHAPTPAATMRARYSAYALAQGRGPAPPTVVDYLMQTWHPSTVPADLDLKPLQWTGLDVLDEAVQGDAGTVAFIAHYKVNGRAETLRETSRFVREGGAWRYVDGAVDPA